jgi:peptide deformylase
MSVREIVTVGHPVLRERAREVSPEELATPETQQFIDDLIDTMRHANGAGIAANQVGVPLRIATIEVGDNPRYPYKPRLGLRVLVNPVVRALSNETYESFEGCLSIPDLRGLLPRHAEVEVSYRDPNGAQHVERFGGLSAGTMQHESDHLDGILFPDRVEDPSTLCTWEMFRDHRQQAWLESIRPLLDRYPGETETA